MNISIKGKNIVLSGGTSGVGKKMVEVCTKEGANVLFGGRNKAVANKILQEVSSNEGNAHYVYTDVSKFDDCIKLFKTANDLFGNINGFINYAGVTPVSPLTNCSEDVFDNVMDVNFKAAFFCCGEAVKAFRKNGGGSIVLIGSPHAWNGEKDRAAYACSKGALLTLMNHISHNYGTENIRCNYLTMGWTLTEGEIALRKEQKHDVDAFFREAASLIPMKRLCVPDDYVELLIYLLSDASSMVSGSVLQATGGLFI